MRARKSEGSAGGPTPQDNTHNNSDIVAESTCLDKQRHPLSAAFGNMPPDEFAELVADVKRNGLVSTITTAEDGSILDGWHRYRACITAGVQPRFEPFEFVVEPAAESAGRRMTAAEFVCASNAHRRHLTAEMKRQIIIAVLEADPTKSDRTVAQMAKVSHPTVAAVRAEAEASGKIYQSTSRKGADGRTTKAVKSKPAWKTPPPAPAKVANAESEIKRIVERLEAEGKKNMATMSPGTVAWLTRRLKVVLLDQALVDVCEGPAQPEPPWYPRQMEPHGMERGLSRGFVAPSMARVRDLAGELVGLAKKAETKRVNEIVDELNGIIAKALEAHARQMVPEYKVKAEKLDSEIDALAAERERINGLSRGVLTVDEFRQLRQFVHPDKHPENPDKAKASFAIVTELEKYVKREPAKKVPA